MHNTDAAGRCSGMTEMIALPPFSAYGAEVKELFLVVSEASALIICPSAGTTLAVERSFVDSIIHQTVSEEFLFLLIQRGMASCPGSPSLSRRQDAVDPTFFLIDLTKACNLQCAYCFRELDPKHPKMDDEMLSKICDELIAYTRSRSQKHISIQAWGGEPLLELPKIEYIRRRFDDAQIDLQIVIETNATLITESTAKALSDNRVDVGVSIDGPSFIHDRQRPFTGQSPSLSSVEKGIEQLRRAGYERFGSITVVTRCTYQHLEEVVRYLSEDLKLPSIKLNLMRQTDRNRDMALDLDEIEPYTEKLLSCLRNCMSSGIQIVEMNVSQRIANLLFRPCDNICNAHGCHGGYRMLSVDSNGNVFPCELTDDPAYAFGTIGEKPIDQMVSDAISNRHIYFQDRVREECNCCPWQFYCRGGCKAAAKYNYGDPRKTDRTECAFNRAIYPKLVEIILNEPDFCQYLLKGTIQ